MLLCILIIGYSLRLFLALNNTISKDGIQYIQFALDWNKGATLSIWHVNDTILYIFCLRHMLSFGVAPIYAGLSINIVLGVCFIVLTFFFMKSLTGNSISSLVCAFLVALHPTFILLSADILRENLFLCLSALVLIYIFSDRTNGIHLAYLIPAAFFTSCAILTRAEGIMLLPFIVVCIWIRHKLSFALLNISIYLLLSSSLYFFIIQCLAPEHRINIFERTVKFIF